MELNKDDYCDECWLIVSSENQELKNEEAVSTSDGDPLKSTTRVTDKSETAQKSLTAKSKIKSDDSPIKSIIHVTSVAENQEMKSNKSEKTYSEKYPATNDDIISPINLTENRSSLSKSQLGSSSIGLNKKQPAILIKDQKSLRSIETNRSRRFISQPTSGWPLELSTSTVLSLKSEFLHGAKPNDSDLCLECLVKEHNNSFEKNLLQNVYGSVDESHECRMISILKRGQGNYMRICSDSQCPKFKFWKIVDSGGDGWTVDSSLDEYFPPPQDLESSTCFTTSDGLCSKEQMVELSQEGLSPRIMDEVRPDIEVSEWFCGRGDSTSRYGFKVSLLDNRKLMMCVYGECKTLVPPEAPRWRKVTYTFHDYDPGVRYLLFHHGGQGGSSEGYPGSKMAGASICVKLPRDSQLLENL